MSQDPDSLYSDIETYTMQTSLKRSHPDYKITQWSDNRTTTAATSSRVIGTVWQWTDQQSGNNRQ